MPMAVEIVIAHYNENLDWLSGCADCVTIYSKGETPKARFRRVQSLPNVGRESHTYLSHIVRNYDRLADVTLFLQGNIHDWNDGTPPHTDFPISTLKRKASSMSRNSMIAFGRIKEFQDWDGIPWLTDGTGYFERRGKGIRMSGLTPGQFWKFIFGADHPQSIKFSQGALFAVGADVITRRPLKFWQNLLKYFEDLNHKNPEEGHYMERFWMTIFSPEKA